MSTFDPLMTPYFMQITKERRSSFLYFEGTLVWECFGAVSLKPGRTGSQKLKTNLKLLWKQALAQSDTTCCFPHSELVSCAFSIVESRLISRWQLNIWNYNWSPGSTPLHWFMDLALCVKSVKSPFLSSPTWSMDYEKNFVTYLLENFRF